MTSIRLTNLKSAPELNRIHFQYNRGDSLELGKDNTYQNIDLDYAGVGQTLNFKGISRTQMLLPGLSIETPSVARITKYYGNENTVNFGATRGLINAFEGHRNTINNVSEVGEVQGSLNTFNFEPKALSRYTGNLSPDLTPGNLAKIVGNGNIVRGRVNVKNVTGNNNQFDIRGGASITLGDPGLQTIGLARFGTLEGNNNSLRGHVALAFLKGRDNTVALTNGTIGHIEGSGHTISGVTKVTHANGENFNITLQSEPYLNSSPGSVRTELGTLIGRNHTVNNAIQINNLSVNESRITMEAGSTLFPIYTTIGTAATNRTEINNITQIGSFKGNGNTVNGTSFADTVKFADLTGSTDRSNGNTFDLKGGRDTVEFSEKADKYTVVKNEDNSYTVTNTENGDVNKFIGVESFKFADKVVDNTQPPVNPVAAHTK
jgi:hypothetical protein